MALPGASAHHAGAVLRLRAGDAIVLFNGDGGEYAAQITGMKPAVTVDIGARRDVECEAPLSVTLAQVIASGDAMDWLVQKSVELGVARLVPLMSSRSVVRLSDERAIRRREHWRQIAIGAAEQCGRNRLMAVEPPCKLPDFLALPRAGDELRLVMSPVAGSNLGEMPAPKGPITLLVGPEGGFAADEIVAAQLCGYRAVRLGPRVLRAETAGIAAMAAMLARWGDY